MHEAGSVNGHYLNRLVAVADSRGVEATEDIFSGQGVKLVAKGGNIDARVRDRLLQHKLLKPLEHMVRVVGGVASRPIDTVADALIRRHALLAGICSPRVEKQVQDAFFKLQLSSPLEALLSLFSEQGDGHLEHAVGVALIAAALSAHREANPAQLPEVLMAGLMHDVGELYIDPDILRRHGRLPPTEWKHVATHPLVGASILRELPGAGTRVAEMVLQHHERLDGFGYPRGLREGGIALGGQILAMAEMLMGVIESGRTPGEQASIAVKLIPGEFDRGLMDLVISGTRHAPLATPGRGEEISAGDVRLVERAHACAGRLQEVRAMVDGLEGGGGSLKALVAFVRDRVQRLEQAMASTGLSIGGGVTDADLSVADVESQREMSMVVREMQWRLDELERYLQLRCEGLPPADAQRLQQALGAL